MKFNKIRLVLFLMSALTTFIFAQGRSQGRGMRNGLNQNSMRPYYRMNNQLDINNPIIVEGKITYIETVKLWNHSRGGIQLTVKNKKDAKRIQMGPEFYFKDQKIHFKKGDIFIGKTYRGEYNKNLYLFAADVEINGKKFILRDKNGFPVWRNSLGYRRGNKQKR